MEITATPNGVVPTVIAGNVKAPSAFKIKGIKPRNSITQILFNKMVFRIYKYKYIVT